MSSITANSLRSGKRAKDAQGSDPHLSKVVELNSKNRLFFRAVYNPEEELTDIAAAMVPGRSCDFEICGTGFIPYTKEMYDLVEGDVPDDLTGLKSWARIARVLHDAQCTREKKSAEAEARRTAEELQQPIDQISLSRALDGIELKYHGGKAADGTNIMPKKSPAISGMQQKLSTQLLVVKLLPSGAPDWKNAKYAVLELSKTRITELITILDDPNYCEPGSDWIEVGYDYIGADKQSAGRAAKFSGIAKSLSLSETFKTEWEQIGKAKVDGIANGNSLDEIAMIMRSRNRNLKGGRGPNDIISAYKTWCAKNAAVFAAIDFEADNVAYTAKDFLDSHIVDSIPSVKAKFEEIVKAQDIKKAEKEAGTETPTLDDAASAPAKTPEEIELDEIAQSAKVADAGVAQTLTNVSKIMGDVELTSDDDLGDL